jgi:hypothetical protein
MPAGTRVHASPWRGALMLRLANYRESQAILGPVRTGRGKLPSSGWLAAVLEDLRARVFNWGDDLALGPRLRQGSVCSPAIKEVWLDATAGYSLGHSSL